MCSSEKNKVKTTGVKSQYVRLNGWSLPLNCMQIFAWLIVLCFGLMTFAVETLSLQANWWPYVFTIIGLLYCIHWVFLIVATSINPADDRSIERMKRKNQPYPVFDREVHSHVIENNYCYICEVSVSEKSKHCSACNKCVAGFDHHCKWLNNCIGEKNYNIFLGTLATAILAGIGMFIISMYVFVNAVQGFQNLNTEVWWNSSLSVRIVFLVFLGIKIVLLLCSLFFIVQLLFFHIMLLNRRTSTYDYLKQKMQVKEERRQRREQENELGAVENGTICNAESDVIETARSESMHHPQTITAPETVVTHQSSLPKEELPKHALMKQKNLAREPNDNTVEKIISPNKNNAAVLPHDNPSYLTDDESVLSTHTTNNVASVVVHVSDSDLLPNTVSENGDNVLRSKNFDSMKKQHSSYGLNDMLLKNSKLPPIKTSQDPNSEDVQVKKRQLPSLPNKTPSN